MAEKIRYICRDCRYKFSWRKGYVLKCPFCNKANIEIDNTTADAVLRDISMIPER